MYVFKTRRKKFQKGFFNKEYIFEQSIVQQRLSGNPAQKAGFLQIADFSFICYTRSIILLFENKKFLKELILKYFLL